MTMKHHDSFDFYSSAQLSRAYTLGGAVLATITAGGRNGTNGLNLNHTNLTVSRTMDANTPEGFEHFSVDWPGFAGHAILFALIDNATLQMCLVVRPDRKIEVRRSTGTILGTTSGALPPPGVHMHVQFHWKIHGSTGVARILFNGVEVLNLTGQNTQSSANAYATVQRWGDGVALGGSTTLGAIIDDWVFNDTNGSVNNALIGDKRVQWCPALAEGAQNDFTPSTGTDNAALVDDNPANDDTDYISSSTVGHIDYVTINVSPAVPAGATVAAVGVVTTDKKTDGGTRTARHKTRFGSGPTVANGPDFAPSTAYSIHRSIIENAITPSEINAPMQVGVEVQS